MVAHYQVLGEIGSGGMGVVYKARDVRLGRLVALKMLRAESVADQNRRQRFLHEAKAASALNHPNIVTVYDVGEWDDGLFLSMEYIGGKTLASTIAAKPLAFAHTLKYAIQTAAGLAAAHQAGIVHRDLKPANVMIAGQGQVKLLDFGIAKLIEPPPGEAATTVTDRTWTREGDVVGSIPYMSPEQAQGKPLDTRSDIFSFGTMLYEMVTGQRPFRGGTTLTILSAIVEDDPVPPVRLNPSIPPEVERVVMRCLEKDPARRFQDARDLKMVLEWLERDLDAGRLEVPGLERRPPSHRSRVTAGIGVAFLAICIGAVYWLRTAPQQPSNAVKVTNDLGLTFTPALSPDGKLLAYASDRGGDNLDIWVQQLPGGEPARRTTDPADDVFPDFSPDGSTIAFERAGSGVFVMNALAGKETLLAPGGVCPRFSPDGTRVAYWVGNPQRPSLSGAVYITSLEGGTPKRLGASLAYARFPLWLDDGNLLVRGRQQVDAKGEEWWVLPINGGSAFKTGISEELRSRGIWPTPDPGDRTRNGIVFSAVREQSPHLWFLPLNTSTWQPSGPPRQVTFGAANDIDPSAAAGGQVAFFNYVYRNNLWRLPLGESRSGGIERLSSTAAFDTRPSISADGKRLAFVSRRSKARQVWVRDMEKGTETELTIGPGDKSAPTISADGSAIAYSILEQDQPSIYVIPTTGSRTGIAQRVCENCGEPSEWTPDGKGLLYVGGQPNRVYQLDVSSGKSMPILTHSEASLDQAHISPDGRWVTFVASADDEMRIFIARFPPETGDGHRGWIAVTDGRARDDKPRWMGKDALVYVSNRDSFGCLWKQRLDTFTKRPAGDPTELYAFHTARLSLRTVYRGTFEIAATPNTVILNLSDLTGNIWVTTLSNSK